MLSFFWSQASGSFQGAILTALKPEAASWKSFPCLPFSAKLSAFADAQCPQKKLSADADAGWRRAQAHLQCRASAHPAFRAFALTALGWNAPRSSKRGNCRIRKARRWGMAQGGMAMACARPLAFWGCGHHHQLRPPKTAHPIDITPAVTPPWIPHHPQHSL